MSIEFCRFRKIAPFAIETSLLVPSFSSRGDVDLTYLFELTSPYISKAVLLSAYDIHHSHINERSIYVSDVVFIDSGGYEARNVDDLGVGFSSHYQPKPWSLERYREVLDRIRPLAQVVLVSYDYKTFYPLPDQIHLAGDLFRRHAEFASDFLCKPRSPDDPVIDFGELVANTDAVKQFSVLGLTEKELGNSILGRCRHLLRLRSALSNGGLEIPIHIFGCLEPDLIAAYFLCGADIFDGLSWSRYSFNGGLPIYHRVGALVRDELEERDLEVLFKHWISNLEALDTLNDSMVRYCDTRSFADLAACCSNPDKVLSLIRKAGLEIGG